MAHKFTIEEFKKYCLSKDSMCDILHYMTEDSIDKANVNWTKGEELDKQYVLTGISPMGKSYTAIGIYEDDYLVKIEDIYVKVRKIF